MTLFLLIHGGLQFFQVQHNIKKRHVILGSRVRDKAAPAVSIVYLLPQC